MKLLFFYGNYCRFCKLAETAVKEYAQETGLALECVRVDDAYGGYSKAKHYEIPRIPAIVLTEDDGEEICRMLANPYFDEECTAETLHTFFDEMLKGEETDGRTEPESAF